MMGSPRPLGFPHPAPDSDGYTVIPAFPNIAGAKGIKCGECGMKFEHDKSYGYCCGRGSRCPCGMS